MASSTTIRPGVVAAREMLARRREKLRQQHQQGTPGIQVCNKLTDLADSVIVDLFKTALEDLAKVDADTAALLRDRVALVAHGGYGRRELAPYSDIDLMILHAPSVSGGVAVLAERLLRDIFDVGFILGQSVRTPRQAITLACQDAQILTSLIESRHVAGNEDLTHRFVDRLARTTSRRAQSLYGTIEAARREERLQYGDTVYLLEPNIKRSRGGLRDIQFIRWIGFCGYRAKDVDGLFLAGAIDHDEQTRLRAATEFLLRVRNEVHFHAGKPEDRLDRVEQVRLAERFGYKEIDALLPVEQFMQDYFRHTGNVRYISARLLNNARRRSWLAGLGFYLMSHTMEGDFRVGPYRIGATRRGLSKLRGDLAEAFRLCQLANLQDKRIAHKTWEAVREAAANAPDEISPEVAEQFLTLLNDSPQLFRLLSRLHELGVLEKLIPAFRRARGLLQFNEYHQYTVDEHCLRTLKEVTEFAKDPGPLGQVYRQIKQKPVLHLAALLHDLGKGYVEDHSEVGRRIATETAQRLFLSPHQQRMLEFLVHQHLLMTHLALWRDINDPKVVYDLAYAVGSPEVLRMLYVLSAADLASVGPGVLNDWKIDLLTRLEEKTMRHLSHEEPVTSDKKWLKKRRAAVADLLQDIDDHDWSARQIEGLPSQYLRGTSPQQIADTLRRLRDLKPGVVAAWGSYNDEPGVCEFTVGTYESVTPGIFHKLTGALSGLGLEILSAQINTLKDGLVLDRFHVVDPEYSGSPPAERITSISDELVEALTNHDGGPPTFRRIFKRSSRSGTDVAELETRAMYDNSSSDHSTLLEIFTADRPGLLYTITRALYQLDLSVVTAKIGTHLDQVVDVFYVTDLAGNKIEERQRLEAIRTDLLEAIENFEHE